MSIIAGQALRDLVDKIVDIPVETVGYTSVDVNIDNWFAVEVHDGGGQWHETYSFGVILDPNRFVKARLDRVFTIPKDVVGMFTIRSKYAQIGLEQSTSVFMHPGFNNKLILELKNFSQYKSLNLLNGDCVGQITFFRCSEEPVNLE